jgi:hypothetical protein
MNSTKRDKKEAPITTVEEREDEMTVGDYIDNFITGAEQKTFENMSVVRLIERPAVEFGTMTVTYMEMANAMMLLCDCVNKAADKKVMTTLDKAKRFRLRMALHDFEARVMPVLATVNRELFLAKTEAITVRWSQ